jgi:hypothetical protein
MIFLANKTKSPGKRTEEQKDCNESGKCKEGIIEPGQQRKRTENWTERRRTIYLKDTTCGNRERAQGSEKLTTTRVMESAKE